MTHRLPRLLAPLALALLSGLWGTASAQETSTEQSEPRWYQVELLVFARTEADSSGEHWPRDIRLRYPLEWTTLKPPVSDAEDEAQPPPALALARLPEDERAMNRYARAMSNSGEYRILFHQAWRQPVENREQAPWLLISGGEQVGNHHELEGSVRLSVSRYLHLRTRLWLTDFEPNYGQPPGAWPELPRHPETPAPELSTPAESSSTEFDWSDDWRDPEPDSAWDTRLNTTTNLPEFMDEEYVPERIVTMNQERRMRSEELHYLDHPLMGLLIRVDPWEEPEKENASTSEAE